MKHTQYTKSHPGIAIDSTVLPTIINFGHNVYKPLTGFVRHDDYRRILSEFRLANGKIWPIPLMLPISYAIYKRVSAKKTVALHLKSKPVALLHDISAYRYDKAQLAQSLFGTTSVKHPGIARIAQWPAYALGGDIEVFPHVLQQIHPLFLSPEKTKALFAQKKWKTIAGFQTRNIPHRCHEFLQTHTLKKIDGLFIQPVVGFKKKNDFADDVIIQSYRQLLQSGYKNKPIVFGVLPFDMYYAGPREALCHALIRRNFGCTHFIVGRDHAGANGFYPPYAAHDIFDTFDADELDIQPLRYKEVIRCFTCKTYRFGSCHINHKTHAISSTRIRGDIMNNQTPPSWMLRPSIGKRVLGMKRIFI